MYIVRFSDLRFGCFSVWSGMVQCFCVCGGDVCFGGQLWGCACVWVCVMSLFLVTEVLCVTLYVEVGTVATLCWVLLVCVKWVWKMVGRFRLKQEHYYFGHVSLKMWNHNIREHTTASAWVFLSTSPSHLSHLWFVYAMYPHQHTQTLYTYTNFCTSESVNETPACPSCVLKVLLLPLPCLPLCSVRIRWGSWSGHEYFRCGENVLVKVVKCKGLKGCSEICQWEELKKLLWLKRYLKFLVVWVVRRIAVIRYIDTSSAMVRKMFRKLIMRRSEKLLWYLKFLAIWKVLKNC